jgi:hypothetical protein
MCAKSLKENITVKNITGILDVADMHGCQELKEKAIAFIGRQFFLINFAFEVPQVDDNFFSNFQKHFESD